MKSFGLASVPASELTEVNKRARVMKHKPSRALNFFLRRLRVRDHKEKGSGLFWLFFVYPRKTCHLEPIDEVFFIIITIIILIISHSTA